MLRKWLGAAHGAGRAGGGSAAPQLSPCWGAGGVLGRRMGAGEEEEGCWGAGGVLGQLSPCWGGNNLLVFY